MGRDGTWSRFALSWHSTRYASQLSSHVHWKAEGPSMGCAMVSQHVPDLPPRWCMHGCGGLSHAFLRARC